jgi:hypothetical protein
MKYCTMKARHSILCLSLGFFLALGASRPAQAAACTEAKMKADKQRVDPIFARGDLRRFQGSFEVSEAYWNSMSSAQKNALATSVVCAVHGPGGVYSATFHIPYRPKGRIVGVWNGSSLQVRPVNPQPRR